MALKADVVANVGAYSCFPTTCGVEPLMAMAELPGPYDVRNYQCRARGVLTNTCPMAPYRGVSRPVITFALERLMDKAAAAFGIDAGRNPPPQPDRQFSLHFGDRPGVRRGSYRETLEMAVKAVDVPAFRARQKRRARKAAISASALPRSPSAPATAARPLPRAAWRSRRAGRTSSSASIRPASSRRASAPRRTARACARRWRRSSPTRSACAADDQGRARRHRPHALRLGHLRQPLAGDLRRRHA